MSSEYTLYCDESDKHGRYFSHFYGGVLIPSQNYQLVNQRLGQCREKLHLDNEVKWSKVSSQYLDKYIALIDVFFDLISRGKVKVRIMFTQNTNVPLELNKRQKEYEYFLLYYQFLKHAFGFQYRNPKAPQARLRLYLDRLPDTKEKGSQFKSYLEGLNRNSIFRGARIVIDHNQIAEVRSHDHDLLQCLDVVLGAIQFRLNDKHKEKPPGQAQRGKKTIAKEKLYKHIYGRICEIHPRFNPGCSTGLKGEIRNRWLHPYRHWLFVPRDYTVDASRSKRRQKK